MTSEILHVILFWEEEIIKPFRDLVRTGLGNSTVL